MFKGELRPTRSWRWTSAPPRRGLRRRVGRSSCTSRWFAVRGAGRRRIPIRFWTCSCPTVAEGRRRGLHRRPRDAQGTQGVPQRRASRMAADSRERSGDGAAVGRRALVLDRHPDVHGFLLRGQGSTPGAPTSRRPPSRRDSRVLLEVVGRSHSPQPSALARFRLTGSYSFLWRSPWPSSRFPRTTSR